MPAQVFLLSAFSLMIVIVAVITATYLSLKRKEYPYSNISPVWIIVTLISLCISQLFSLIDYLVHSLIYDPEKEKPVLFFLLVNFLVIHNLVIIPLIVRTFSLGQSIKYNYNHLTRRFYDHNFQQRSDCHFRNKYYSRNFYYFKLFSIPLIIIFLLIIALLGIPYTKCAMYRVAYSFYGIQNVECEGMTATGDEAEINRMVGDLLFNLYFTLEAATFFTLLILIFRYPIKQDKFYLRLEFVSIFFVWILRFNIEFGVFYLSGINFSTLILCISDSVFNISIVGIYAVVTLIRKQKISDKDLKALLKDFLSFMNCHVTFNVFKDFIHSHHEDDYKLLTFWVEFFLFKEQAIRIRTKCDELLLHENAGSIPSNNSNERNERLLVNQYEEELKQLAEGIFQDYFSLNSSDNSQNKESPMLIDLPLDIYDKLEDCAKKNFAVENLENIFDECFIWVKDKLNKLFIEFQENKEEQEKLVRILFFIDFYEIRRIGGGSDDEEEHTNEK